MKIARDLNLDQPNSAKRGQFPIYIEIWRLKLTGINGGVKGDTNVVIVQTHRGGIETNITRS